MADDQGASNEEGEVPDYGADETEPEPEPEPQKEIEIETTTIQVAAIEEEAPATTAVGEDDFYDDGPLPDVTVNLYIDDVPEGVTISPELVNVGLTDKYGNLLPTSTTPWADSISNYTSSITQEAYDELNGTGVSGKGWWGSWTWNKILFVGLIALCIIGIILAVIFLVLGKKSKKNKRPTTAGSTTATKSVVSKDISPGTRYEPV